MNEQKEETKNQLVDYVTQKINEKVSGNEIKMQLRAVGWSEDEVDKIYALSLTKCGIPIPNQGDEKIFSKKSTASEIVVNIFSFIALGFVAIIFGILCHNIIDYFFPDPTIAFNFDRIQASATSIHYAIASLIVAFPIYFFAIKFWFSRFKTDEGKTESSLTKWITYFVLLITALVFVGDLIAVIFYFLRGETTNRFVLKAITIFVISGGIFGFYYFERKRIQFKKQVSKNVFYSFGLIAFTLIITFIGLGFYVAGSPTTARKYTFDKTRASDLSSVSYCVERYAKNFNKFPTSLESMENLSGYSNCLKKDPETKKVYEYNVVSEMKEENDVIKGEFELCADFSLDTNEEKVSNEDEDLLKEVSYSNGYYNSPSKWSKHSEGRECDKVKIEVRKDLQKNSLDF